MDYALNLQLLGEGKTPLPELDRAVAEGQDDGVADLGRAIELDERAIVPACQALHRYFELRKELQRFEPYRSKYEAFVQKQNAAAQERRVVKSTDRFASHEMDASDVEKVAATLREHQTLCRAWLGRSSWCTIPRTPFSF